MAEPGPVGILLAAGRGQRFGADKRLVPLDGGAPMALVAARAMRSACARVVVVLRPEDTALAAQMRRAGCETVACAEADGGMGHSLAAGVRATAEASGWLVALADMPWLQPCTHARVAAALAAGAALARPVHAGRPGHPVGFAREWFAALAALTGDRGARDLVAAAAGRLVCCEVDDPGCLRDVDTPQALAGRREGAPMGDATVARL